MALDRDRALDIAGTDQGEKEEPLTSTLENQPKSATQLVN